MLTYNLALYKYLENVLYTFNCTLNIDFETNQRKLLTSTGLTIHSCMSVLGLFCLASQIIKQIEWEINTKEI